jgi:hypothetical protein
MEQNHHHCLKAEERRPLLAGKEWRKVVQLSGHSFVRKLSVQTLPSYQAPPAEMFLP